MTSEEAFKHASENSLVDEYHGALWRGMRTLGILLQWTVIVYLLVSMIGWIFWGPR